MNTRLSIIGLSLIVLSGINVGCVPREPEAGTREVSLFFYSESDLRNAVFDHPVETQRNVTATTETEAMDAALRLLFAGPTEEERRKGALTSTDLTRLGPLFLGIRKEENAAIVNFRKEALEILNSAAARQFMAKEPIRRTLLQFPGIADVRYAIDGKIFEEWDA